MASSDLLDGSIHTVITSSRHTADPIRAGGVRLFLSNALINSPPTRTVILLRGKAHFGAKIRRK